MAKILLTRGQNRGMTYFAGERKVTIGRDPSRTIPILDGKASRLHAEIINTGDGWKLRDLGSTNKTYLNGKEVSERQLQFGDIITIGDTDLLFERDSFQAADSETQPPDQPAVVLTHDESVPLKGVTIEMPRPDLEAWMRPAAQAAVASDPAARKHERRLKILWRVSRTAFVKDKLSTFLEEIFQLILPELICDAGIFFLVDESGELKPLVTHRSEALNTEKKLVVSSTVVNKVFQEGNPFLVSDAAKDMSGNNSIQTQKIRSIICVPLKSPEKTYGVFYADVRSASDFFQTDDLNFMATVCSHVAVNIENLALYQKQKEAYERLKMAQDQLIASEKMSVLGRLSGSVAHELNNPLQCIMIAAEFLEDDLKNSADIDRPKSIEKLEMITHSVGRCVRLVQNLLHYSRKSDATTAEPVSLRQPLDEAVKLMGYMVSKRGINLQAKYPEHIPLIQGNANELEQVFINLIKNGADAINGKGEITVELRADDDFVTVFVSDTGSGIKPEHLPHIWEELFTTKPVGEGTGLGLPLCKRIVEKHGGSIDVSSNVGEGTTFIMRFPLAQEAVAAA